MSLIKLLQIPTKLFKKDVITFFVIRRHDLGVTDDKLRYIAIRPTASVLQIRRKLWYLLDLADYCEEIIVLKNEKEKEIPLSHLRDGNDPHHAYIIEVWPPDKSRDSQLTTSTAVSNSSSLEDNVKNRSTRDNRTCESTNLLFTVTPNRGDVSRINGNTLKGSLGVGNLMSEYKPSELSCKISSSTLFFKMHGKKSRDNFANLLLKIQSDLNTLSDKLSNLEERIQL